MLKRLFILIILTSFLVGCGAKKSEPVVSSLPMAGYKKEMEDYELVKAQQRPSPSLWADVGSHGTIFLDYKARFVGDIIIIRIVESSSANNSSKTNTNKTSSSESSVNAMLGLPLDFGMNNFMGAGNAFDPSIGYSTNKQFNGSGSNVKSDSISATIAARVVSILPSGNLVVEGQREIIVDQQKQTITIRGVVRQKDIDSNNVVASTSIADAQITYSGDGVITDANRKGWLATFFDWVWPF